MATALAWPRLGKSWGLCGRRKSSGTNKRGAAAGVPRAADGRAQRGQRKRGDYLWVLLLACSPRDSREERTEEVRTGPGAGSAERFGVEQILNMWAALPPLPPVSLPDPDSLTGMNSVHALRLAPKASGTLQLATRQGWELDTWSPPSLSSMCLVPAPKQSCLFPSGPGTSSPPSPSQGHGSELLGAWC